MATQTKPRAEAAERRGKSGLEQQGLASNGTLHWNLVAPELAYMGPFVGVTTPHTGRSPNDKFVVREPSTEKDVWWGKVNQPFAPDRFDALLTDVQSYLSRQPELFIQDLYAGADPKHRLAVRFVSPSAWHMLFVRNMFIRPELSDLPSIEPGFSVLNAPEFKADPERHGTRSGTFIILNFARRMILIGGTRYAGELKKSIF